MTSSEFIETTLELAPDYEGPVIATLLKSKQNRPGRPSVLYLHGFIDYFFHNHLAEKILESDYNFYALDLRKYGRSLLSHQHPNYCRDMEEYFEEIDESIKQISDETENTSIIIYGHSTGGLIATLYAGYGKLKARISGLILNSPFFEFNAPFVARKTVVPLAIGLGKLFKYGSIKGLVSRFYVQSLHKQFKGRLDFNLDWKPEKGFPVYFAWIRAIRNGHRKVKKSISLSIPVLILHSDRSLIPIKWSEKIRERDIILNVEHIKKYGKGISSDISWHEIPGAVHDCVLSDMEATESALNGIAAWLNNKNQQA
jgi:alpha-beta hydrolase superfamily lysophospholipase